jgi:DNA (cytosine-5)-methyltransferase 3A
MNILSLFDGISCGQVALERAGIKVDNYYASEIDKYAIQVTMKNYPNTIQVGDVTKVDFSQLKDIDLLIGGSSCQGFSCAGKGLNFNDERSKLFFEFVRALETIKPKYFLLENVASMQHECRDIITKYMGVEPILINSNCFSAQDRPRYYWTNIPFDKNILECNLCLNDILEKEVDEKYFYSYPLININMDKQVCATMQYKNNEMHKRIFNPKFKCHTLTTCGGGNTQKKVYINGKARKLTPLEYERLQTLPDGYTDCVANSHRYNICGNGWTVDVIAHIFKGLVNA